MFDSSVIAECRAEAQRLRHRLREALGFGATRSPAATFVAEDVDRKLSGLDRQLEAITSLTAPDDGADA